MKRMPGQPSPRFHEAFPDYPSEDHSLEKREEAISCLKHEKKCFFRLFGFFKDNKGSLEDIKKRPGNAGRSKYEDRGDASLFEIISLYR